MKKASGPRTSLIRVLVEEHRHIKLSLSVLNAMHKRMTRRLAVPPEDLATVVRFISEYADKIHHHGEEELLFPALERTSNRQVKQMAGKLGTQHLMGRLFVSEMKDALREARTNRRGWRKRFLEHARSYHTLLTIHICDENNMFFPLAEKALTRARATVESTPDTLTSKKKKWEARVDRLYRKYCPSASSPCGGDSSPTSCDCEKRAQIR